MKSKLVLLAVALGVDAFAAPLSYYCRLVERAAGHHGIVLVHGDGVVKVVDEGAPGIHLVLKGPHDTIASVGSYEVHVPTEDYYGRLGKRKLLLNLYEKDSSGYSVYFHDLILSVDDGGVSQARLHRDLEKTFLRIECHRLP